MKTKCNYILAIVLLISVSMFAYGQTAGGSGNDSQFNKFRLYTYSDQMSQVWAFKLLIPEGWNFDGGINWMPKPYKIFETHFTVSSPGADAVMEVLPDDLYWWSQNPGVVNTLRSQGVPVAQPMQAIGYLEHYLIPKLLGNAQGLIITKRKTMPDVANGLTQATRQLMKYDRCFGQLFAGTQVRYSAGQVDASYAYGGNQYFETFITRVVFIANPTQPAGMWGAEQTVRFRTVQSQRDEQLTRFVIMYSSFAVNPVFNSKICQVNLMMVNQFKQYIRTIGELSAYISKTYDEISDMVSSSYRLKDSSNDRVFDNWADYMRSVETFVSGDLEVKVPVNNNNVWRNGDEVIFSGNPGFNPHKHFSGSWEKMRRRQ